MTEQTPAAAPAPLDRDTLAKALWILRKQFGDWESGSQKMRDYWLRYADAVIAHVATNPFPLNGEKLAFKLFTVENDAEHWNLESEVMVEHWTEYAEQVIAHLGEAAGAQRTVMVTLFKPSGKYYTCEAWRAPSGAYDPRQMRQSPDFHRIAGGIVLVDADATSEFPHARNFGTPHLFPAE